MKCTLHRHVTSVFVKHSTMNVLCSPSHTIVMMKNGIFFPPIALLDIDLVANNFFKTVNTNLEHPVIRNNISTYRNTVCILADILDCYTDHLETHIDFLKNLT